MHQKIEKGSAKWNFFQDFFKFIQDYAKPDIPSDPWWEEAVNEAQKLTDKYANEDFIISARGMVLSHLEEIECRYDKGKARVIQFRKGGI